MVARAAEPSRSASSSCAEPKMRRKSFVRKFPSLWAGMAVMVFTGFLRMTRKSFRSSHGARLDLAGSDYQALNVGSAHPPHTQGKVQSAVSLALSGIYLLQTEALIGLIDRQTTSKVPAELSLPIMAGLER